MKLLDALELVVSFVPGFGPALRAIRLIRLAVDLAEAARARRRSTMPAEDADAAIDRALDALEAEETA